MWMVERFSLVRGIETDNVKVAVVGRAESAEPEVDSAWNG